MKAASILTSGLCGGTWVANQFQRRHHLLIDVVRYEPPPHSVRSFKPRTHPVRASWVLTLHRTARRTWSPFFGRIVPLSMQLGACQCKHGYKSQVSCLEILSE